MTLQEQLRHTSAFADQWRVRGAQLEEVIAEKDKVLKRVSRPRSLARGGDLPRSLSNAVG